MSEPTRVYIAAPWSHKRAANKVANYLREEGYEITSSWLALPDSGDTYEKDPDLMCKESQQDLDDLDASDAMLYLNLAKSEGKATELGYAISIGLPIYVIGGKGGNVFLHLPWLMHLNNLGEFFDKC